MSNYLNDELKSSGSTPIKRLGLSRKRKSSCLDQVNSSICSPGNAKSCSETEIKKQNMLHDEICYKNLKVEENFQDKSENKNELEQSILGKQTKYKKEIEELENLCSIWANGFKNALLYLINLLQKRPGESVNVKQLLMQMRIWEIISDHFKNDSELCVYLSDGEDSD